MKVQNRLEMKAFKPNGGFVDEYQKLIREVVIPYQYSVLCDEAPDAEKSHVVQNFLNTGRMLRGEDAGDGFYGMVFQDSDGAKWLEAAAYSLNLQRDPELEKTADAFIDLIADAQDEDGYLNTYYTLKDREKRWQNLLEGHELYCSGHMMEAACAYYEATGKRKLLDVMCRNARHIYDVFVKGGHPGYPGHPEIELALLKMYRATGDEMMLEMAKHFLNIRGVDPFYYEKERKARTWTVWNSDGRNHAYQQSDMPVRELQDAAGHAVRAVYLYTAMADLASLCDDVKLNKACKRLWDSIAQRQMYVTGAIGSTVLGEAFSKDYDLPNDTAYAETCASIGLMMFASRMLEKEVNGEYADVMERAFYNTVLAGMQQDGQRFFYVNPLEVVPGIADRAQTHQHVKTQRPRWYACACCPPNVARMVTSLGQYAYGESESTAYCHLYAQGTVNFKNGMRIRCETAYPYDFTVKYHVEKGGRIAVRIPAWSVEYELKLSGMRVKEQPVRGYVYLNAQDGDLIELVLSDAVRFVYPSAKVPALTGLAAVMRGPLVYCFEGVDNGGDVLSLRLDLHGENRTEKFEILPGKECVRLVMDGYRSEAAEGLYSFIRPSYTPCKVCAVPYYLWGNRGENQMRVWMGYRE